MKFEWDPKKNKDNYNKHGISFETASLVFEDPNRIDIYDFDHSLDEDRFITIGLVGRVLFVVSVEREDRTRIISARLANSKERKIYYDGNIYD